nr:unnamed protein product [Callosobruchus analis]
MMMIRTELNTNRAMMELSLQLLSVKSVCRNVNSVHRVLDYHYHDIPWPVIVHVMEETLIEYVRANPVLYDPANREYRNQNSRKEAWDKIGEKLGITGNDCKENWNKLRNAYIQAKNRRATKSGQAARTLSKWKFEDEMAFLNPTLTPRTTRENTKNKPYDEDDYEAQKDASSYQLAETDEQLTPNQTALKLSEVDPPNSPGNDQVQNGTTTMAEVNGSPTTIVPNTPKALVQPSAKPMRSFVGKRQLSSSVNEMVTVMKDNQRLRSQLLQSTHAVLNKPVDDECELFFLSMAKHVKKLRPHEQIRVKMELDSSTPPPHQSELSLDPSTESISSYTFQDNQQHNFTNLVNHVNPHYDDYYYEQTNDLYQKDNYDYTAYDNDASQTNDYHTDSVYESQPQEVNRYYSKNTPCRYVRRCIFNDDGTHATVRKRHQLEGMTLLASYFGSCDTLRVSGILWSLKADEISLVAKKIKLIREVAMRYITSQKQKHLPLVAKRNMRRLARLLIKVRKVEGDKSLTLMSLLRS